MKRYSVFAIAREAFRDHTGWERAWRNPTPKAQYDAIIVGAPTLRLYGPYFARGVSGPSSHPRPSHVRSAITESSLSVGGSSFFFRKK